MSRPNDPEERAALLEGAKALELTRPDQLTALRWQELAAVLREMADCYEVFDAA